ncbi:ACT domain-containing protein, partial [Ruminococcaceae bacterium OttesenSCG-928-N02]|nr:ACT domain-containing protein [Ruminococcaceae bacterium OttesenSCG-928-N02]
SVAARMAGISRSAFYKYKDKILDIDKRESSVTLNVSLIDRPGALQTLLGVLSAAGSNIAFVSQVSSGNDMAMVSLVCRTTGMIKEMDDVIREIKALPQVLDVSRALRDLEGILK